MAVNILIVSTSGVESLLLTVSKFLVQSKIYDTQEIINCLVFCIP